MSRRRAFTLVELLIVIGIIAVLVAILLPVMNKSREAAKGAQCLSNLRQIGQKFAIYFANNKDAFYPASRNTTSTPNWYWYNVVFDMPPNGVNTETAGKGVAVLYCPKDPQCWQTGKSQPTPTDLNGGNPGLISYGYNAIGLGGYSREPAGGIKNRLLDPAQFSPEYLEPIRPSRIRRPSETVLCVDSAINQTAGKLEAPGWFRVVSYADSGNGGAYLRHSLYGNVLWCDGSASAQYAKNRTPGNNTPDRYWLDFYSAYTTNPSSLGTFLSPNPPQNKWDRN